MKPIRIKINTSDTPRFYSAPVHLPQDAETLLQCYYLMLQKRCLGVLRTVIAAT